MNPILFLLQVEFKSTLMSFLEAFLENFSAMLVERTFLSRKALLCVIISSVKHTTGKKCIGAKEIREKNIVDMLKKYDQEVHPAGETLSDSVRVFRVKIVSAFMMAGVPLEKIECFREILEETSVRLSSCTNLRQLVPFVHQQEQDSIKKQISGKQVCYF